MSRLVIASAAKFEIEPLMESLIAAGIEATYLQTGVGLVESSIVASRLRDIIAGRDVIFCCTGGIIGKFTGVELFQGSSIELAPHDVREGNSYLLSQFDPQLNFHSLPIVLQKRKIYGSLGVTKTGEKLVAQDGPLETIELYGVARAWLPAAATLTAIIASTNATGAKAHDDWLANHIDAAKITASVLASELKRLGFGTKGAKIATN